MNLDEMKIEIKECRRGNILATSSIEIGNSPHNLKIGGFKIMHAKFDEVGIHDHKGNPLWVAPPAFPDSTTGRYINIISMGPELERKFQTLILKKYINS